jgi:hypothetical protein
MGFFSSENDHTLALEMKFQEKNKNAMKSFQAIVTVEKEYRSDVW